MPWRNLPIMGVIGIVDHFFYLMFDLLFADGTIGVRRILRL
jgi:hypothetical protein